MSYEAITLEVDQGLAHLTLNQPEIGNPFNEALCRDLNTVSNELLTRTDVRAVLLKANGKFFSVGGDIGMFAKSIDELPFGIRKWTADMHMGIARLARIDAPIVAAVHASAMGGAVALLAGCDLVYSARSAKFGAAYSGIGFSCDAGASHMLATRMGIARARRFLILAEMLKSDEAAQVGLVDYVVDDEVVMAEAEKMARRLAGGPTRAYGQIRRLFTTVIGQSIEAQLENEALGLATVAASADAREGLTAFVEKRKPVFTGK